jgi:carbamoyltransferase
MKIVGVCSGHDVAYAIFEDGIPIIHNELERFSRKKGEIGDAFQFLFDTYEDVDDIKHASYCVNNWRGGISKRFPESYKKINSIVTNNNGKFWPNNDKIPGHHQCHAANAFFSSNLKKALIVTIDGGGEDYNKDGNHVVTTFTVWQGIDNKIYELDIIPHNQINLGVLWDKYTTQVFGLSGTTGAKGSQAGTVMGMAALGDPKKFKDKLFDQQFLHDKALESEQNQFDIAASLQEYTENIVKEKLSYYLKKYPNTNLCLSGGVALNSVMTGKIQKWFTDINNIYLDPVPYDAGIALGGPRYIWHHIMDNPRIIWSDNATPYLGTTYTKESVLNAIIKNNLEYEIISDSKVIKLLIEQNIISVFGGGSESGRRALGNRSIIADPRSDKMKDLINEKVKHRQWFRPFAPSILREEVSNWFEQDINSPYMGFVSKFKKEKQKEVPAVVHFDGSARLQTVTQNDNKWYYNFIKKFYTETNVPILLNTSFNDREPIVETPENAIECFLRTNIDYLYFRDYNIILRK